MDIFLAALERPRMQAYMIIATAAAAAIAFVVQCWPK
jgi:hypothetical protein